MTHDEADRFFEHLKKMPKDVQLSYIHTTFGDLLYDTVKDWDEYQSEHDRLDILKKKYIQQKIKDDFNV
jgi:hypothetical protein